MQFLSMKRFSEAGISRTGWANLMIGGPILLTFLVFLFPGSLVFAATVVVPQNYVTIQDAVDAVQNDAVPGTVIINSSAIFDETVKIRESITILAGDGFLPTIEKTTGYFPPMSIRASGNAHTIVIIKGIAVRAYGGPGPPDSDVPSCISVSNLSENHTLDVTLDNLTVTGDQVQNAIIVSSATINSDISFTLKNSSVRLIGEPAGSPSCVRLHPYAYNLNSTIDNNHFRFSHASGIDINGGRDDKSNTTIITANFFEGFISASGEPRAGIDISGTGNDSSDESSTFTSIANNTFLNTMAAVDANGQQSHTHTIKIYNNSIFGSKAVGLNFVAFSNSTVDAAVYNNIVSGTGGATWGGYGIYRQESSSGIVSLKNNYNIIHDSATAHYFGAPAGDHSSTENPRLNNPASGDFHLNAGSPAIGSGICGQWQMIARPFPQPPLILYSRIAPYDDFEGDPRPGLNITTGCEIGADEYAWIILSPGIRMLLQ